MKLLKIVCAEWNNASRDKRELSVVESLGAQAIVMAKGKSNDNLKKICIDGFDVFCLGTKPLGTNPLLNIPNKIASIFSWAFKAKSFNADVFSCHDLGALLIGWLSTLFTPKARRPLLVYDCHEYTVGLKAYQNKYKKEIVAIVEKFLMKKCVFSIMVNETISERVQTQYNLKEKPLSIKNTPSKWVLDEEKTELIRQEIQAKLKIDNAAFVSMYHGAVLPYRGIETFIKAVSYADDVYGIVLGNFASEGYEKEIKALVEKEQVKDKILFLPAVPHKELKNYIGAVDCGVSLLQNTCENHLYALPNKFFECIQCLTPVVVSDFPAISAVVDEYGIGLKCNPASHIEVANAFNEMKADPGIYRNFKSNMEKAREELCWEKEKEELIKAYKKILIR